MDSLLPRLLGADAAGQGLTNIRMFFVRMWPVWAIVTAMLFFCVWVAFFYRRDGSRPTRLLKTLMACFRVLAMGALLVLLFQPTIRGQRTDTNRSMVAVILDASESMTVKDTWKDQKRRQDLIQAVGNPAIANQDRLAAALQLLNRKDADLLNRLEKKHILKFYVFGNSVKPVDLPRYKTGKKKDQIRPLDLPKVEPALRNATRIGNVLEQALADAAGQPLAGIVLVSDGGQNLGEDPVVVSQRAAEAGVPVYTLGMGDPNAPQDIAITTLLADEVVRKGDEVVVTLSIRHRGYGGRTVPITMKLGDRVLETRSIKLGTAAKQDVNLSFVPGQAGPFTLSVATPVQGGELSKNNNHKLWPIRVVDKKLKILYVEGSPRWEYRFLKNAILRDPTTQFACILTDADPSLGGEGNVPIYGFPKDKKSLYEYDIMVLGDVPREYFSDVDLKNIQGFVEERGGSLIAMAGMEFMPWAYRDSPIESVLPVVIPPSRNEVTFTEPFQMVLTEAGAGDPMMFVVPDRGANEQVWRTLPGLYWCGIVERPKPGAIVLSEHPTRVGPEGKLPMMLRQQTGEGTTFMTMVDSTWQWRYRVGDKYFYRFWGQVIRSLTPHELPGDNKFTRVRLDKATYTLGENVNMHARLLTPNYHPVRVKEVAGKMVREDGQEFPVRLQPQPGTAGMYAAEWLPEQPGTYKATLVGPQGQASAVTNFVVEASSLELEAPEQNEQLLKRIAGLTNGAYISASDLATVPDRLADLSRRVESQVEFALWDVRMLSMAALIIFTMLLVGEWVVRKAAGLL